MPDIEPPSPFLGPVNILLVFVPLGIIAGEMGWNASVVFTLNFFAIIPLAAVLSFATEEISKHLGDALGGLLNATFGNAVELIVSVSSLSLSLPLLLSARSGLCLETRGVRLLTGAPRVKRNRSVSLRCAQARSRSYRLPCWARSCPISFWSWACASS